MFRQGLGLQPVRPRPVRPAQAAQAAVPQKGAPATGHRSLHRRRGRQLLVGVRPQQSRRRGCVPGAAGPAVPGRGGQVAFATAQTAPHDVCAAGKEATEPEPSPQAAAPSSSPLQAAATQSRQAAAGDRDPRLLRAEGRQAATNGGLRLQRRRRGRRRLRAGQAVRVDIQRPAAAVARVHGRRGLGRRRAGASPNFRFSGHRHRLRRRRQEQQGEAEEVGSQEHQIRGETRAKSAFRGLQETERGCKVQVCLDNKYVRKYTYSVRGGRWSRSNTPRSPSPSYCDNFHAIRRHCCCIRHVSRSCHVIVGEIRAVYDFFLFERHRCDDITILTLYRVVQDLVFGLLTVLNLNRESYFFEKL